MKGYLILKPSRFAVNSSSHGEITALLLLCKNKGTSHSQTIRFAVNSASHGEEPPLLLLCKKGKRVGLDFFHEPRLLFPVPPKKKASRRRLFSLSVDNLNGIPT